MAAAAASDAGQPASKKSSSRQQNTMALKDEQVPETTPKKLPNRSSEISIEKTAFVERFLLPAAARRKIASKKAPAGSSRQQKTMALKDEQVLEPR